MKPINICLQLQSDEYPKSKKHHSLTLMETFYFPVYFSKWQIDYKSFFRKPRKNYTIIGVDLVKGSVGLADFIPKYSEAMIDHSKIIEPTVSLENQKIEAREFIRKYYIHYKRVWSPPQLKLITEEIIHLPYTIYLETNQKTGKERFMLFEHSSKSLDTLSKYSYIEERCLPILRGGEYA